MPRPQAPAVANPEKSAPATHACAFVVECIQRQSRSWLDCWRGNVASSPAEALFRVKLIWILDCGMAHPNIAVMRPESARPLFIMPEKGGTDAIIGTGFIVIDKNELTWLVTAAHTPTMTAQPSLDWSKWPMTLRLTNPDLAGLPLALFHEVAGMRVPLFRFLPNTKGSMADMLALYVPRSMLEATGFDPTSFISFRERMEKPQALGEIIGYGFPRKGETWPYYPPDETKGSLTDTSGIMYQGDLETRVGHSGGPVFTQDGAFVGMMIGSTNEVAQIVPDILLNAFVNGTLQTV